MVNKNVRSKFRKEYPLEFKFDYKDPGSLSRFLVESGKIIPSRVSKLSLRQQRKLNQAIKKSRQIGLLPVGSEAFDNFSFPEPISAKPFSFETDPA